jgi:DNA (cytosine-5)-methyltransferase 1
VTDLTYLSLFSGIGGLDLGLDRAGWTCVGQVELDAWCRTVLDRHWPEVPKHDDVRTAPQWWAGAARPTVRLVAGGPPCQGASRAGERLGVDDPRWGWPWFLDMVRAVGPDYALMENPPALLDLDRGRAFSGVLGTLADLGFDAQWSVLSACAMGAPHTRERLFIVAHPQGERFPARRGAGQGSALLEPMRRGEEPGGPWAAESRPVGVAYGATDGVARRRAAGNAVVPQVGELVGRLIRDHASAVAS